LKFRRHFDFSDCDFHSYTPHSHIDVDIVFHLDIDCKIVKRR
jgi:hypothetical protein